MSKKDLILESIAIFVGNFVLAFGVSVFIIPNNILSGGVAGIAIALSPIVKFDVESIITFLMIFNFILGIFFLGKQFALKTLASSILYPIFLNVLSHYNYTVEVDPLLASIYGGLVMGLGIGLVFKFGASTGGMDIPPLILNKYTKIKTSTWLIVVDGFTILLGLASFGIEDVLIGLISAYVMSKIVNYMQTFGGNLAKQVFIITDSVDEVVDMITNTIDRGATIIDGEGAYTKESRRLILTVLLTSQYAQLEKMVKEIDHDAFLIVSDATEVHGYGFIEPEY